MDSLKAFIGLQQNVLELWSEVYDYVIIPKSETTWTLFCQSLTHTST